MPDVTNHTGPQVARRPALVDALSEAEGCALRELGTVRDLLARAVEAARTGDLALADDVIGQSGELDRRYGDVHDQLLALIARQAPVAGDLRLATALLHVNDRIARMGAQCLNIATLCKAIPDGARPSDGQLECLTGMSGLADQQVAEAARVFAERDVEGAPHLRDNDVGINAGNRHCFELAVREGLDEARRETGFLVALMARALERIGDNAVDIGQQAAFVATGRLRVSPVARELGSSGA